MKKTLFLFLLIIVVATGCTSQSNNTQSSMSSDQKSAGIKEEKLLLSDKVDVNLTDKGFQASDIYQGTYQDYITMKFELVNKTDKDIKGVQGKIVFYDIFDNEIFQSTFSYDEGIPAYSTINWDASIEYNQFMDDHEKLKNTALENLRLEWLPDTIIYSDGTKEQS